MVSDESLDLWSLDLSLLAFLFDFSSDDVESDIIFLLQVEELSDVVSSLWSKSSWELSVSET